MLLIIDGWGIADDKQYSAIDKAKTPFIDSLYNTYPHSKLSASAEAVGLPKGQMGNSEVGHLTIGSGRVINQSLLQINDSIESKDFHQKKTLLDAFQYAITNKKNIHLIGLVSDGGIHSHISHIMALCTMAKQHNINNLFLHAFTDGRDTEPGTAFNFLRRINDHMLKTTGALASIMGRFYAMDRNNRWQRTAVAYNALVDGAGDTCENLEAAESILKKKSLTDEFFTPILITAKNGSISTIKPGDVVISFNFRTDRMRQLTSALTQKPLLEFNLKPIPIHYITMTEYDSTLKNVKLVFLPIEIKDTLSQVLSQNDKSQLRIAETEKYPHVTYFFSGGNESIVPRETRIMCPSPKVNTYDLCPEMAALEITNKLLEVFQNNDEDFICVNLANADMVGHTGNFSATVRACEVIDECLQQIIPAALKNNYTTLIISDHGNADKMMNKDGSIYTAHTSNYVPCILIDKNLSIKVKDGTLADIAPTILDILDISKPKVMTGVSLIE